MSGDEVLKVERRTPMLRYEVEYSMFVFESFEVGACKLQC
jgi:hypothetical protein